MRRLWTVLAILLLVVALVLPAFLIQRVEAQGPTNTPLPSVSYFDFTTGLHGWTLTTAGGYQDSSGLPLVCVWGGGSAGWETEAYLSVPSTFTITRVEVWYEVTYGSGIGRGLRVALDTNWSSPLISELYPDFSSPQLWTGATSAMTNLIINLRASSANSVTCESVGGSGRIIAIRIDGTTLPFTTVTPTPTPTNTPVPTQPPVGSCQSAWNKTWDFTVIGDAEKWGVPPGYQFVYDETGYHTVPHPNSNSTYSQSLDLSTAIGQGEGLESTTIVTNVSLDITYSQGSAGSNDVRRIQVLNGTTTLIDPTRPPASGHQILTWSGSAQGGNYEIVVFASGEVATEGEADGSATVNSITLAGVGYDPDGTCEPSAPSNDTSSWAYPIASADQLPGEWLTDVSRDTAQDRPQAPYTYLVGDIPGGSSYDTNRLALMVWSRAQDSSVHSMTDGEVTSIVPLNNGDDPCLIGLAQLMEKIAHLPDYHCPYVPHNLPSFAMDYHDASSVTITTDTAMLTYLVRGSTATVGETVSKGCILGKTLTFQVLKVSIDKIPSWDVSPDGYSAVQARDLSGIPFDIVPFLREEPKNIECGGGAGGGAGAGGCAYVKDPSFTFTTASAVWQSDGGTAPTNPVGTSQGLWLKANTYQQLNLDSSHQYSISVTAHLIAPASGPAYRVLPDFDAPVSSRAASQAVYDFSLQLRGNAAQIITITSITPEETQIGAASYTPSANGGFVLELTPTANTQSNIVVDFVCVSDTDSGPTRPTGGCLVLNPEFDTQTDWTIGDGAAYQDGQPGILFMPNGATASQSLRLSPKTSGSQVYKITVEANLGYIPAEGQSFTLDWSYGGIGSGSLGPFVNYDFRSDSDQFTVSTAATLTLTLQAVVTDSAHPGQLSRVCIETADGSDPPGYRPPGPPGITPTCKTCSYVPVGNVDYDLSGVIAWLLCGLSQIWNCQMKQILYGIWQVATNILTFLALLRLWMSNTISASATWANTDLQIVARWLNGQFINLGQMLFSGPRTVISSDTGSNLWDVLRTFFNTIGTFITGLTTTLTTLFNDLKDVLTTLISALFTLLRIILEIVAALINLIVTVIFRIIMVVLGFIQQFISLITGALNAPAITPAGIPVCDDTGEQIAENCVAIFMIDTSILSDNSPLWQMFPLIRGAAGFGTLLWAAHKFRAVLSGTGDE